MKVYISTDIEGITGAYHWDETEHGKAGYEVAHEQMIAKVAAACEGALQAGATEVWVKDAYDSARNIIAFRCPERADRFGFFPGVRRTDSTIVQFEHADFFEVLRFLPFAL
ncbi:MAG: M55 family metallopeptidase [Longilinea sp.]|nr:M55 family metallopeptidase [Longilinea sp.]